MAPAVVLPDSEPAQSSATAAAPPILEVVDLFKSFGEQEVLRGINLKIDEGKITVIIGGSGSGKSVLIKHLVALLRPDRGEVRFRGRDLFQMSDAELLASRRHFGMLFQSGALFDSMSVYDNVAFPLRETPASQTRRRARTDYHPPGRAQNRPRSAQISG